MKPLARDGSRLKLDVFEGPLDLLLYLIRKHGIDIHDIPIAEITSKYQALLEQAREDGLLDLDFAGEYFVLAATLIQIKSRMLLPQAPDPATGEPPPDPREDLVRQLLDYERFREAASVLHERADLVATMLARPDEAVAELYGGEAPLEADLVALARAFHAVLEERRLRTPHVLAPARYTVRGRMEHVLSALERARSRGSAFTFRELFEDGTVEECVATFLALLELVKLAYVACRQTGAGAEIHLELLTDERAPAVLADSEFDRVRVSDDEEDAANDGSIDAAAGQDTADDDNDDDDEEEEDEDATDDDDEFSGPLAPRDQPEDE